MAPALAIAIAQGIVALVGLFRSASRGVPDLLSAQMDALRAISEQITVVNAKLDVIYSSLEELLKLTRELPDAVVTGINQSLVNSAFGRHEELLRAYQLELGRSGIAGALQATRDQFEDEVLKRIRSGRDDLLGRRLEFTIPTLCKALQVEVQTMILLRYNASLIRSALESYQVWFGSWSNQADIAAFPRQLQALTEQFKSAPAKARGASWTCYHDVQASFDSDPGITLITSGMARSYQANAEVDQAQLDEISEADKARASGAELPEYFDELKVRGLSVVESPMRGLPATPQITGANNPGVWVGGKYAICPSDASSQAESARQALVDEIAGVRAIFLAKASLALAAAQSARYCAEFIQSPVLSRK